MQISLLVAVFALIVTRQSATFLEGGVIVMHSASSLETAVLMCPLRPSVLKKVVLIAHIDLHETF